MLKISISLLFLCVVLNAKASLIKQNDDIYKIIKQYEKHHKEFRKNVCTRNNRRDFYKHLRSYRGKGFWIPVTLESNIDIYAIKKNVSRLRTKVNYINTVIHKMKNKKKLPNVDDDLVEMSVLVDQLLEYKKNYFFYKKNKSLALQKSIKGIEKLKKLYNKLINKLFFLKSFNYPNNHLENRFQYEKLKKINTAEGKSKANLKYFFRRIVEDGARDKNGSRSDFFLRTTIDNLFYQLQDTKDPFISENIRYDLRWVMRVADKQVKRGYNKILERLEYWLNKTILTRDFYESLLKSKSNAHILNKKINSSETLKSFVFKKQVETYKFWLKKEEKFRAIFALETILFNEVGRVDGYEGLDRKDVSQVVLNRFSDPLYNYLKKDQGLLNLLEDPKKKIKLDNWLNVLFKEGEFSFTYYYMGAVANIFCPEMTKTAIKLRKENLKIVLKKLRSPQYDFRAVRYFSRASMLGKIDMSTVWNEFVKIPMKPGPRLAKEYFFQKKIKTNDFTYLYPFIGFDKKDYHVVKFDRKIVVLGIEEGRFHFYKYRSPHLFTYFKSNN